MSSVKATFETADQTFPAGTKAVGFKLTLTAVGDTAVPSAFGAATDEPIRMSGFSGTAALDAKEIVIQDITPGTYTGRIALVDAAGEELAPGVVDPAPITVLADDPTLTFPAPSSLTLTLP